MTAKASARSPITFHDVAMYFSEEEWEFLEEWQKELYKNVMCEIHGALISMGYAIVNPGKLFQVKKEEKPFAPNLPACKKAECFQGHTSGSTVVCPDILLRIKQEENPVIYSPPPCKKRENMVNLAPHHPAEPSVISVHIKEEEDPYMSEPQHSDRSESFSSPTASSPIVTSVFSLHNKPVDSSYSNGRQDVGKGFLAYSPGNRSDYPALEKKARLRNLKFNLEELEILIGEVVWHYDKLFGLQSTKIPMSDKYLIWKAILERINGVGRCSRNIEMLKKRWNDFKRKTREKIISNRASAGIPSQQQKLSALEKKVATVLRPEQLDRLFQQPDRMEFLLLEPSDFDELSSGADTFTSKIGAIISQKDSEITLSDSSSLQEEHSTKGFSPTRTRGRSSKQERFSDLEKKVATVLRSEQIELLESYSSSRPKYGPAAQHWHSNPDTQVQSVLQMEHVELPKDLAFSSNSEKRESEHNLSKTEVRDELPLNPEKMDGMIEDFDLCRSTEELSRPHNVCYPEKHATGLQISEQELLPGLVKNLGPGEMPMSQEKQCRMEAKGDLVESPRDPLDESAEFLKTSHTGISTSTQQSFPVQDKSIVAFHQLGHVDSSSLLPLQRKRLSLQEESLDLQPGSMEEVNLQLQQTDDYYSSESESACEETSLRTEELDAPRKSIHVSECSSEETSHHCDKNKKQESMAKTLQSHSEENKENKATFKKAPGSLETKTRNERKMKETLKNENTIYQQTNIMASKCQDNRRRETSLPCNEFDIDNQHIPASIFPLAEKLESFMDLQKKQYEALKCSMRQMNVYLHSQSRTLVKINSSIQRQTSAINQLARAQQASATNIEILVANVLQTNTSLVEGNAVLNKTVQEALALLQLAIKAHYQQEDSPKEGVSMSISNLLESTTTDITSVRQPAAGQTRTLSGGYKLEGPSTRKRRKKRMRTTSVELIPL